MKKRVYLDNDEQHLIKVIRENNLKDKTLNFIEVKKNSVSEIEEEINNEILLSSIPESIEDKNYFHDISGLRGRKGIIAGDFHIPFHSKDAVITLLKYIIKIKPEFIILNGDIFDNGELSTHLPHKNRPKLIKELTDTKEFLKVLRQVSKDSIIYYKSGNHEEKRFNRKLMTEAREFADLQCLELDSLLELANFGIRYVRENEIFNFANNLFIIHGHEIGGGEAKQKLNKAQNNIIANHHHKTDYFHLKRLDDTYIEAHFVGAMCNLKPLFYPHNNWNNGFLELELGYKSDFVIDNKKI